MGDFFDWLGGLGSSLGSGFFESLLGAIGQVLSAIVQFIVGAFNALVAALGSVFDFFGKLFSSIGGFFSHLWNGFFKNLFTRFFQSVAKAAMWLEDHLQPLIDWLKKARKWLDRIFNTYIKPILDVIEKVHRILQVLTALHVKWAQQLDQAISKIENKVLGIFLKIRATLNQLIDVVTLITDPELLLRRPQLIVSIRRSIPAIFRAVTGMPIGFILPGNGRGTHPDENVACAHCIADTVIGAAIGLPFPTFLPQSVLPDDFADSETGLSVGDWSDVRPLGAFADLTEPNVVFVDLSRLIALCDERVQEIAA